MSTVAAEQGCLRRAGTILLAMMLAGCGSVALDEAVPRTFDLNGRWLLESGEGGMQHRPGGRLGSGFLGQDFPLLVVREMRIEQDDRSMGIEYGKGSYRDVSWGERRRGIWEVRAGWHEGDLHIYSKAPDVKAEEVWKLSADGQRLDIHIHVRGASDRDFHRVFRRADPI